VYSIRNKLNSTIIVSMVLILSLTAIFLYLRVAEQVEQIFDDSVYDKAQALISLTELYPEDGLEFEFAEGDMMQEFVAADSPQYYQLWENGVDLLIKSPSLGATNLPRLKLELGNHRFANLELPDGRNGRLIEINFLPRVEFEGEEEEGYNAESPTPTPITLVFARERKSLDSTLLAIATTFFGVTLAVVVISALLVWLLVGGGLAPLSNLARQVGNIDESRLEARLTHEGEQSVEIAPIEDQLNHLLERLQSAFERERRFSSNVAHELRTPLAELKTLSEVAAMVADDPRQVTGFFVDVGEISAQMEKVVTTLLELTRSEAGLLRSDPVDIDLSSYCDEIWKLSVNGRESEKTLVKNMPSGLFISTDREKLGLILSNLFSNAISYSPDNASIEIAAEVRNHNVALEVRNEAIDLKPEDIVHMKDRFWRKHKIQQESGHSGLGLALVDALAEIMKLDIDLQLDSHKIFLVTISGLSPSPTH
jgi:two-component system heavy metal sensor histidine kinase CusS